VGRLDVSPRGKLWPSLPSERASDWKRTSERLAELGFAVVLTAWDEARGEAATAALWAKGLLGSVQFRRLDVADPASVAAFVSWVRNELGGLDILVSSVKSRRQLRCATGFSLSCVTRFAVSVFILVFWALRSMV
jgi:NAD(P)-dependent dehydrogenase (short-subunit alcohol dehydrogenase family)